MNIQLPTGKTIMMTSYEFLFMIKEDEVDAFYQACIADDLGTIVENPFSNRAAPGRLEAEEIEEIDEDNL